MTLPMISEQAAITNMVRRNILRGLTAGETIYVEMQGALASGIIRDLLSERAVRIVDGPYGDLLQLAA